MRPSQGHPCFLTAIFVYSQLIFGAPRRYGVAVGRGPSPALVFQTLNHRLRPRARGREFRLKVLTMFSQWFKKPTVARKFIWDTDAQKIQHTFFEDGELNLTVNCLDRHAKTKLRDKIAIMLSWTDCAHGGSNSKWKTESFDAYIWVDNVDDVHTQLVARHADVVRAPQLKPYGMKELDVRDAYGYVIRFGEDVPSR